MFISTIMEDDPDKQIGIYMELLQAQFKSLENSRFVQSSRCGGAEAVTRESLEDFNALIRCCRPASKEQKIFAAAFRRIASYLDRCELYSLLKRFGPLSLLSNMAGHLEIGLNLESVISMEFDQNGNVLIGHPRHGQRPAESMARSVDGLCSGHFLQQLGVNERDMVQYSRSPRGGHGSWPMHRRGRRGGDRKRAPRGANTPPPVLNSAERRSLVEELDRLKFEESPPTAPAKLSYSEALVAGRPRLPTHRSAEGETKAALEYIKSATEVVKTVSENVKPARKGKSALENVKPAADEIKPAADEIKPAAEDVKSAAEDVKPAAEDVKSAADIMPGAEEVKKSVNWGDLISDEESTNDEN